MSDPSANFTFAIVADSHIRLDEGSPQAEYPSNALANGRNRKVIERLNQLKPDFVIHLGDFVHLIPAQPAFEQAMALAARTFAALDAPIFAVPGNHDVGDKPNVWVPAPTISLGSERSFEEHWGPTFRAFDYKGYHFVLLNAPVINSGFPLEAEQRAWLEADLAQNLKAGHPLFLFSHYPLYLAEPGEAPHYDNLDPPGRDWLLSLIRRFKPAALFAGHVHNFFYDRYKETDMVILPAVSFIRPGFSDLFDVSPAAEYGRDDAAKLGFCLVHVRGSTYRFQLVRTGGAAAAQGLIRSPGPERPPASHPSLPNLGIFLRRGWVEPVRLATANLDEFVRKAARNDYWLWAAQEACLTHLRLPLADLSEPSTRERLRGLVQLGFKATLFSTGLPGDAELALVAADPGLLFAWELIVPTSQLANALQAAAQMQTSLDVDLFICPLAMEDKDDSDRFAGDFDHFPDYGMRVEQSGLLEQFAKTDAASLSGIVFRVDTTPGCHASIERIAGISHHLGLRAFVHARLPRNSEGYVQADDHLVANGLVELVAAALSFPEVVVFFDTFEDHDRGYFPRHGLVDRRYNPRPAHHLLKHLGEVAAHLGPLRRSRPVKAGEGVRAFDLVFDGARRCLIFEDGGCLTEDDWIDWEAPRGEASGSGTWLDLATGIRETVRWRTGAGEGRIFVSPPERPPGGRYPALFSLA